MNCYVFVRTEVRTWTIAVHADNRLTAEIRATVGGLKHISQKEGVEVSVDQDDTLVTTYLVREIPCQ